MDVVSCCEVDVLGVDCAAFDCHVFLAIKGIVLINGFVCFLIFLYVSCVQ